MFALTLLGYAALGGAMLGVAVVTATLIFMCADEASKRWWK